MSNVVSLKKYRINKKVNETKADLEDMLVILTNSVRGLTKYKKYAMISKLLFSIIELKDEIKWHIKKQQEIVDIHLKKEKDE